MGTIKTILAKLAKKLIRLLQITAEKWEMLAERLVAFLKKTAELVLIKAEPIFKYKAVPAIIAGTAAFVMYASVWIGFGLMKAPFLPMFASPLALLTIGLTFAIGFELKNRHPEWEGLELPIKKTVGEVLAKIGNVFRKLFGKTKSAE